MIRFYSGSLLLFLMSVGVASIDAHHFPSQELQARHQAIIEELRCPQCLNTNLAGSDAMIARDLRREVHRLLLEGESDEEILSFMYDRYGDFVLYTPRIHSGTIFLWFGPLFFLILAIAIFISIVKSSTRANVEEVDREELAAILNPHAKELD